MIKVGCCGYPFNRRIYRESLSLVEVNSTFYGYPRLSTATKWREDAPGDFEFTVKAHQDISHKYKLRLEQTLEPFERMKGICRALDAEVLLIQTPASFKPDSLEKAEKFFEQINRDGLSLVWETRGAAWKETGIREKLREILERLSVTHVTDPFNVMPACRGQISYFRLHGRGKQMYYYQYTDEELVTLHGLVSQFDAADGRVYVLFNNLAMFEDANRFLQYIRHGRFPPLTPATGIESVRSVISNVRYPLTRSLLIHKVGWRLVEMENGRQVKLEDLMAGIPSKTYNSADEVLEEIEL